VTDEGGQAPQSSAAARWRALGWGLLALAALMRTNNALRFKTRLGFDAVENVDYIETLMKSWTLPAPDAAWATSHPPLFYYVSAAWGRLLALMGAEARLLQLIPLLSAAAGLAIALMAVHLVRRRDPGNERRAVIAGGLLLFLPVHIYMAAMVNEELLTAALTSLALLLGLACLRDHRAESAGGGRLRRAALAGAVAGLALLTKLTGVLVIPAIAGAWVLTAWRSGRLRAAAAPVLVFGATAAALGGWFYLRNLLVYGYIYPQDLSLHALMFEMPPGEREMLDYLRVPLATWLDPQLLNADLLRSVWGSTYTTLYFDGHRHFLANSVAAAQMGTALLTLALLPCAALVVGSVRGARRAMHEGDGEDAMLLLLVGLTLAGYVIFTWGNPWFATLKASYMLGLSVPFAWYASGPLAQWSASRGALGFGTWGILFILLALVTITFTIGPVFDKIDGAGLPWRAMAPGG
jgi:4-amino-4-deoxy-L-arabinose transferase-like glycosyltransferase